MIRISRNCIATFCLAALLCSCGDTSDRKTGQASIVNETGCNLDTFSLTTVGQTRQCKLEWQHGKLQFAHLQFDGGKTKQMEYQYDEQGKLSVMLDRVSGTLFNQIYNENGQLIGQNSADSTTLLSYVLDDAGYIQRQVYVINGDTNRVIEYQYNEAGLPIQSVVLDGKSNMEPVSKFEFEYDEGHNPYLGTGSFINIFENSYGRAVGEARHNVSKVTLTYLRDPKTAINNQAKKQGMQDEIVWTREYNAEGLPVNFSMKRGTMDNSAFYGYQCN